jgi:hypothetical protein
MTRRRHTSVNAPCSYLTESRTPGSEGGRGNTVRLCALPLPYWMPDRVHKAEGEANPVRVTSAFFFSPLKMWSAGR